MRGVGRLANKEGSVQTRSFGAQRVFAEKSSKMSPLMHRSCTEFNYLLTYSPPVEVRSAEKKKVEWSGAGVCAPSPTVSCCCQGGSAVPVPPVLFLSSSG